MVVSVKPHCVETAAFSRASEDRACTSYGLVQSHLP
jgi:hypothetical protein